MNRRARIGGIRLRYSALRAADSDGVEPALGLSEQFGALDRCAFLGSAAGSALQHGEDGGYAWPSESGVFDPRTRAATRSAAKQIAECGRTDRQFRRARAPCLDSFPTSRWQGSRSRRPDVSLSSALVTTTVDGPRAISACAAPIT